MAIGAAGYLALVQCMHTRHAGDLLDADHALMFGLVRQHGRPGHVANGIDAVHVGLAISVNGNDAAIGLHADLLESQILDIALYADRRDELFGLHLLGLAAFQLDMGSDTGTGFLDLGDFRAGMDVKTGLLELLAGQLGDFLVLDGHDGIHQLDDRHIASH